MNRSLPRWPLLVIALPAAVAVWSGWVGLGTLCGFGIVHPLPGIWDGATINTAITLPIGVEAYGSYALAAWLSPGVPRSVRKFAKWSAIGSLTLGMLGQVAYHLLSAAHAARAPWPVVVLMSSLPVIVLGFGAALSHLLRGGDDEPGTALEVNSEPVPAKDSGSTSAELGSAPAAVPVQSVTGAPASASSGAPRAMPRSAAKPAKRAVKAKSPTDLYAADLAAGKVPSQRRIRADMKVGQEKAKRIQAELTTALNVAVPA